jgi:hypothetical protein
MPPGGKQKNPGIFARVLFEGPNPKAVTTALFMGFLAWLGADDAPEPDLSCPLGAHQRGRSFKMIAVHEISF